MSTIVCTRCNQNIDIGDAVGSVECECGEKINLTVDSPATKPCPECDAPSPIANIICMACGYNFQTGSASTTLAEDGSAETEEPDEEEDDEPEASFFFRYKPLIKLGIVALVIGLAVVVYIIESGKHFGISDDSPIGTKQEIEEYLLKIGMTKQDDPFNPLARAGLKGSCVTYKDTQLYEQSKGMFNEYVHLILDEKGEAAAICGIFISDDMGGPKGGRTHGFLRTLWLDLDGDPKEMTIDNPAVHGKWTTYSSTLGVLILNRETIGVSLKGTDYEKVVDTFCGAQDELEMMPSLPGM